MALTDAEQLFFQTGDASVLEPGAAAPAPSAAPAPNPLELNALAAPAPAPAIAPAPPAPAPAPAEPQRGPDGKFVAATPAAPAQAPAPPDVAVQLLTQQLAETQRQLAQLEAARKPPPPPAEPPAPDPSTDPYGALMHNLAQLQKQITELKESSKQQTEMTEQQRSFQAFQNQVVALRDDFVKTQPDFSDAYAFLVQNRTADLQAMGYTQQQIRETLFREEVALSENAIRNAKNPAQVAYETAKRHGYVPKAAAPTPAAAPAGPSATDIQRAQAASRQLPAAPPSGEQELTLDGLRAASEADINKLVTNDALWNKLTKGEQYPL